MSDSLASISVPVLNKEAKIQLTIGTMVVADLQYTLLAITSGRDTTHLAERITSGASLEDWEKSAVFLSQFIDHIYKAADQQGHVTYRDMTANDILSNTPSTSS